MSTHLSIDEVIDACRGARVTLTIDGFRVPVIIVDIQRQPRKLISLQGVFVTTGIPFRKCDGNHGAPRCDDPECWQC